MNVQAVITASCFTLFSVVILICLIFSKKPLFSGRLKNYFRAVAGVYVSGRIFPPAAVLKANEKFIAYKIEYKVRLSH